MAKRGEEEREAEPEAQPSKNIPCVNLHADVIGRLSAKF
jgi:hypothetical protein